MKAKPFVSCVSSSEGIQKPPATKTPKITVNACFPISKCSLKQHLCYLYMTSCETQRHRRRQNTFSDSAYLGIQALDHCCKLFLLLRRDLREIVHSCIVLNFSVPKQVFRTVQEAAIGKWRCCWVPSYTYH